MYLVNIKIDNSS